MEIESYKEFIDAMVSVSESSVSKWVLEGSFPRTADNEVRNKVISSLTQEQRDEISKIIQEAKESGVHDALAVLSQDCSITYQEHELPSEPFGTELYFDYVARLEGEPWPK